MTIATSVVSVDEELVETMANKVMPDIGGGVSLLLAFPGRFSPMMPLSWRSRRTCQDIGLDATDRQLTVAVPTSSKRGQEGVNDP